MIESLKQFFRLTILAVLCSSCGDFVPEPIDSKDRSSMGRSSGRQVIVGKSKGDDFRLLSDAINAGATNVYIRNGLYEEEVTIVIRSNNVSIIGENKDRVKILQKDPEKDLLVIRSNSVTIKNATFDTETYNAQAAIVEGGGNGILLENNNIFGGSKTFALYFAGPPVSPVGSNNGTEEKDETIDVYLGNGESKFDFSKKNVVIENTITSNFNGDGVSFSLQQYGRFEKNIIKGAMISVYMDKDTVVSGNTFTDSLQSGVYVSLPSENVSISNNIIENPRYHGIVIKPQYHEHGHIREGIISSNITLSGNKISANVNGINVQGYDDDHTSWGRAQKLLIKDNVINQYDFTGIWVYDYSIVEITKNIISFSNCDSTTRSHVFDDGGEIPNINDRDSTGIHLFDDTHGVFVLDNSILRTESCPDSKVMQNAVSISNSGLLAPKATDINIEKNKFTNKTGDWIHSDEATLVDHILIDHTGTGGNDLSGLEFTAFLGIDVQNLSVIDAIKTDQNINEVR